MATYYSPTGNPEVWESKPDGYYTVEEWQAAHPPEPGPESTPEEREAAFNSQVSIRLNAFAVEKQYDSIQNAMLMWESAAFKADGQAAYDAYDVTWSAALELMPAVSSGALSIEDACAQLPPLVWPERSNP